MMDFYPFGPAISVTLALAPTLVMLCILVAFLARHFRISLLLMTVAEAVWLGVGAYSQYLVWSGNWNDPNISMQLVLNGTSHAMTVLNITGMLLLLLEWSRLVRERSAQPPLR